MSVRTIPTILCTVVSVCVLVASTSTRAQSATDRWPASTPAAEGLSPATLAKFDADIAGGKYGFVDSMLVIRHGKAGWQVGGSAGSGRQAGGDRLRSRPAHLPTLPTCLAIKFDRNEDLPYADPNNSCSLMEASYDWVRFAIDRPMAQEPGTVFRYNSGATQLLSHIFKAATGADIEEYAARHLFAPLGIQRYFWKRSPSGLVDTEGGLYLRSYDVAKVAYLFLENGVWDGKPIVQPDWVKASVAPSIAVGDGVQYGFKWWLYPYGPDGTRMAWGGSGLGGQRPIVIPEHDLVIVFTGWNLLPGQPSLSPRVAIDRIVAALVEK